MNWSRWTPQLGFCIIFLFPIIPLPPSPTRIHQYSITPAPSRTHQPQIMSLMSAIFSFEMSVPHLNDIAAYHLAAETDEQPRFASTLIACPLPPIRKCAYTELQLPRLRTVVILNPGVKRSREDCFLPPIRAGVPPTPESPKEQEWEEASQV